MSEVNLVELVGLVLILAIVVYLSARIAAISFVYHMKKSSGSPSDLAKLNNSNNPIKQLYFWNTHRSLNAPPKNGDEKWWESMTLHSLKINLYLFTLAVLVFSFSPFIIGVINGYRGWMFLRTVIVAIFAIPFVFYSLRYGQELNENTSVS